MTATGRRYSRWLARRRRSLGRPVCRYWRTGWPSVWCYCRLSSVRRRRSCWTDTGGSYGTTTTAAAAAGRGSLGYDDDVDGGGVNGCARLRSGPTVCGRSESYRRPPDGLKSDRTTQRAYNNGLCTTTARWPVDDAAVAAAAAVVAAATTTDGIARDRTATRTPPDDVYDDDVFNTSVRPIASTFGSR